MTERRKIRTRVYEEAPPPRRVVTLPGGWFATRANPGPWPYYGPEPPPKVPPGTRAGDWEYRAGETWSADDYPDAGSVEEAARAYAREVAPTNALAVAKRAAEAWHRAYPANGAEPRDTRAELRERLQGKPARPRKATQADIELFRRNAYLVTHPGSEAARRLYGAEPPAAPESFPF